MVRSFIFHYLYDKIKTILVFKYIGHILLKAARISLLSTKHESYCTFVKIRSDLCGLITTQYISTFYTYAAVQMQLKPITDTFFF